ncbi:hypothetical protein [Kitasatospora sp. GP82]|uniref:hypothetical protein n=1 Tax=Kitasatospora sp. GP82 TaxID=3035089 RepID=UPI00247668B6|nr:hypothetical protein [Kitasatospora sp. GP82]MDH6124445.1 hypothetical protein [Kitasatospora sp. GP82]
MPTPHGSRGGMAFSADEVRVLRRALAQALHPAHSPHPAPLGELWAEDVQEALRLAEAVDEAVREGGRLRTFLLADLARYRAALPGSASGYLERLEEAVSDGYLPLPEDLTALRSLSRLPCGSTERSRRSRLSGRCHAIAEADVRERLALGSGQRHLTAVPSPASEPIPAVSVTPIPVGGRIPMSNAAGAPTPEKPAAPHQPQQQPRRMPTPAEIFGRRNRPQPQPQPQPPLPTDDGEELELATGTG